MPVDRGAIDAQLREIGEGERWWEQREFRDLPHILQADERIQGIVNGKLLGRRRPRLLPTSPWLIVVTNQRLICLKQERFARKQVDIAAGQVVRIHQATRLRGYQVTLQTLQGRYRIRIAKAEAFRFGRALSSLVPDPQARQLPPSLEPWSWIPGITTVAALPGVTEIASKVSTLASPDYATRGQLRRLEATVERLQGDVDRLQQQVAFLEDLLEKRVDETFLPQPPADS